MAEILTSKIQKARKHHQCEWCGDRIEKGTKYRYESGVYGGEFQVTKFHIKCENDCCLAYSEFGISEEDQVSISEVRGMWLDPTMRKQYND